MTITLAELQADIEAGTLAERVALAILNSDREMGGWPPIESRETVPDSDGYVANAQSAIAAARVPELEAALIEAVGVLREAQSLFSLLVDPAQFEGVSSGDAYLKIRQAEAKARTLLAKLGADK